MVRVPNIPAKPDAEPAPPRSTAPPGAKSLWVAYALHLSGGGGFLGLARFYLGFYRSAQIQLGLGLTTLFLPLLIQSNDFQYYLIPPVLLWYVVDLFLLPGMARAANEKLAHRAPV